MENQLIYGVDDRPQTIKEWILYPLQQVFAVLTATLLISTICGTPLDSGLAAAGIGTLVYLILSGFKSPMFVSNAGGTCAAVISSLALSGGNYASVIVGGLFTAILYWGVGLGIRKHGADWLNKLLPVHLIGAVILCIGINLSKYAVSYAQVNGQYNIVGVLVALFTMTVTAVTAHYGKGFIKTIPFLVALVAGYILCLILECFGIHLLNFSAFDNLTLFAIPDFTFFHTDFSAFKWEWVPEIAIMWVCTSIVLLIEHLGDHKSLSSIIGIDLFKEPGIYKTLRADGTASFISTIFGGQPNTSYGESISCTAVSRVGSSYVIAVAAIIMIVASFFRPLMAVFESIAPCIFSGISLIAYGYIAFSGLNTLINSQINYNDTSKVMVVLAVLTTGISGISLILGPITFSGVSLAMLVGVFLNLILNYKANSKN